MITKGSFCREAIQVTAPHCVSGRSQARFQL